MVPTLLARLSCGVFTLPDRRLYSEEPPVRQVLNGFCGAQATSVTKSARGLRTFFMFTSQSFSSSR